MFNSGSQTIIARSTDNKEGIEVEVSTPSGAYPTKLPATIAAEPTNGKVIIKVIDKCYDTTEQIVGKSVTPSFWVNILFLPGMLLDLITGNLWKYDTNVAVPVSKKAEC